MVREYLSSIDHYFANYPIPCAVAAVALFVVLMFLFYKLALRFVNTDSKPEKILLSDLLDEKSKKKKPKPVKQKKQKSENKEKENHVSRKETAESEAIDEIKIEEPAQDVTQNTATSNGPTKEKSKKKRSPKEQEAPEPTSAELPVVEEPNIKDKIEQEPAPTVETSSKKKKKNKRKESPEVVYEEKITETVRTTGVVHNEERKEQQVVVEEEVRIVNTQEQHQQKPIENKKKSNKVPVHDLTVEKVASRLTSVGELEPEYVDFLNKYGEQSRVKEAKLNDNVNHLKKQIQDKDRTINELSSKVTELEGKFGYITQLQKQLLDERKQREDYEGTVGPKLAEHGRLVQENKGLLARIEQISRSQATSQTSLQEIENLKGQLTSLRNSANQKIMEQEQSVKQLQAELMKYKSQESQLSHIKSGLEEQNMHLTRELEKLRQNEQQLTKERERIENEFTLMRQEFSKLEEFLHSERSQVARLQQEQLQKSSSDEKLTYELSRVQEEVNTWRVKYQETEHALESSKVTLTNLHNEIDSLKRQNQELNMQATHVAEFETKLQEQQKENDRLRQELTSASQKIEEVSQRQNDTSSETAAYKKLQKDYEKIQDELKIAIAKLEEFDGIYNELKTENIDSAARIEKLKTENEELKKQKPAVIQNHVEHEKENIPHGSDETLVKDLEEQKKKNEELRQRNYKIVEDIRKAEQTTQKMISELETKYSKTNSELVNAVASELRKLAPKSSKVSNLKNNAAKEDLVKWIGELAHVLSAQQPSAVAHPATKQAPKHEGATKDVEELQTKLKAYEQALSTVNNHLHAIERVYSDHEKAYKQKIAQLESQLNNRS